MTLKTTTVLAVVICILPSIIFAQSNYFGWITNSDNTLTLTQCSNPPASLQIPETINGLPVTVIGPGLFSRDGNITNITIPQSITSIEASAFASCVGLTTLAIPSDVTNIGSSAFEGATGLTSVVVPDSVTSLGNSAFVGCFGLTNAVLGCQVPNIGVSAFEHCGNLAGVTFRGGITNIGLLAFAECSSLANIIIPGTVSNIDELAFRSCSNLTNVVISPGLTSIGEECFLDCTRLGSLLIPESVTNIQPQAFESSGLTNASVLGNATIGEYAFYQTPMIRFYMAAGTIGESAFQFCSNLTSLTVGDGVASLGVDAFDQTGLSNILIPGSVTNIGDYAFEQCNLTNVTICYGVKNIGDYAFLGNPLSDLTIPGSVTSIGDQAFFQCNLTNVIIGGGVTNIFTGAFSDCGNLTSALFVGNAPAVNGDQDGPVFWYDPDLTVYYLPGTKGWSNTYGAAGGYAGAPTALWNPIIEAGDGNFGVINGQFGFDIKGGPGIPIVVEACTNLANPVWTPVQSMTVTNGLVYFSDPNWSNYPTRYYGIGFP